MNEVQTKCPIALPIIEEFNKIVKTVKSELECSYKDNPNLVRTHMTQWRKAEGRLVGVQSKLPARVRRHSPYT